MRILIANSDLDGLNDLEAILAADGHEVTGSANPHFVLKALRSAAHYDVLITMIGLPSISGLELSWEARLRTEQGRPIYVIVLSRSKEEETLAEALDCGADDFLVEPVIRSELLARLRAAARVLQAQNTQIRLASFDSLTGLRNRRSFFEELEKCGEAASPTSVIMLDIDYFKKINDTHGHEIGDDVLREIGRRLSRCDKGFSRLGGEEFGLLARVPLHRAAIRAEKVRKLIGDVPVETRIGALAVTVSLGVATRLPGVTLDEMMKDADIALYASKSGGRNRVTVSRTTTKDQRRSDLNLLGPPAASRYVATTRNRARSEGKQAGPDM